MAEEKVMVCAGFNADNEKDCVAGGGKWVDENDILLVGVGASKGKVIGVCRIMDAGKFHLSGEEKKERAERMSKMSKGEIMVTGRTTPNDIIYMKKASAFITDRGGKGAHAGVVAREWGIPAVVGTIKATSVLKDGQKVFLDGEKGIILNVLPEMEAGLEEKPKPTGGPSLADNMAAVAKKRGFDLPPGFMEKMKRRE